MQKQAGSKLNMAHGLYLYYAPPYWFNIQEINTLFIILKQAQSQAPKFHSNTTSLAWFPITSM